jgi:hypothetical protein
LAREVGAIPVGVAGDVALVAAADSLSESQIQRIATALHRRVKLVRADHHQLLAMIESYYPPIAQAG